MQIITMYLLFSMLAVIWFDMTRYTIPNWLSGSLLLLYPVAVYASPSPVDWQFALLGMGIVLVFGYLFFIKRWMGGGDIKLIVVCCLWTGWHQLVNFLFLLSIFGGLFALVLWGGRKALVHVPPKYLFIKEGKPLPRILTEGESVPYGVAIAIAFVILLLKGQIPAVTL